MEQKFRWTRVRVACLIGLILSLLVVIGVIVYNHQPSVRVQNALEMFLDTRQVQVDYELIGTLTDLQGQSIHMQFSDGTFAYDRKTGQTAGSAQMTIENGQAPVSLELDYVYSKDKGYWNMNQSGWVSDNSANLVFMMPNAVLAQLKDLDWSKSGSDKSGLISYQADLSQKQLQSLTKEGFPSSYGQSCLDEGTISVSLDKDGRLVRLLCESQSSEEIAERNSLTNVRMDLDVKSYDVPSYEPVILPEHVRSVQDDVSGLDVILVSYGIAIPDLNAWDMGDEKVPDGLAYLENDWAKVTLDDAMFPYVETEDSVLWAYPSKDLKKGSLSVRISFGDALCTEDLVLADRKAADTYFAEQKNAGAVKEVNLGNVQTTTHHGMWVFWYLEQYTNCTVQAGGDGVVRTYHFYVKREDGDGFVKMDVQEVFDTASQPSLGNAAALQLLDSLVIERL